MCLLLDANPLRYAELSPSMKKVKVNTPSLIEAPEALSLQGQIGLPLHDYRLSIKCIFHYVCCPFNAGTTGI